jgi:hypothetical protein
MSRHHVLQRRTLSCCWAHATSGQKGFWFYARLAAEAMASAAALEPPPDWRDSQEGVAWAETLDAVDVAIAERRGLDALNALQRAEALVSTVPPVEDRLTCVPPGADTSS